MDNAVNVHGYRPRYTSEEPSGIGPLFTNQTSIPQLTCYRVDPGPSMQNRRPVQPHAAAHPVVCIVCSRHLKKLDVFEYATPNLPPSSASRLLLIFLHRTVHLPATIYFSSGAAAFRPSDKRDPSTNPSTLRKSAKQLYGERPHAQKDIIGGGDPRRLESHSGESWLCRIAPKQSCSHNARIESSAALQRPPTPAPGSPTVDAPSIAENHAIPHQSCTPQMHTHLNNTGSERPVSTPSSTFAPPDVEHDGGNPSTTTCEFAGSVFPIACLDVAPNAHRLAIPAEVRCESVSRHTRFAYTSVFFIHHFAFPAPARPFSSIHETSLNNGTVNTMKTGTHRWTSAKLSELIGGSRPDSLARKRPSANAEAVPGDRPCNWPRRKVKSGRKTLGGEKEGTGTRRRTDGRVNEDPAHVHVNEPRMRMEGSLRFPFLVHDPHLASTPLLAHRVFGL
ncbi:hypothetical protein B0H13DRAFT_1883901 [Mycena leptocephala]|nr:hypothetical protein B0H13DRAFT_1883901 [Mycena leptocephala]